MSLKLYPEENIQSIANAIRTKNGSSDTYTVGQMAEAIENIPTGGGGGSQKSVVFYDYDGTVVDSYTEDEFAELSAMPNNPSHEGLVAQGWNWTLADAKAYVQDYGALNIGQMYITESGDTEIDIELQEGMSFLYVGFVGSGNSTIDWGDNSSPDTVTAYSFISTSHTYATPGAYTIKIHVVTGGCAFTGDTNGSKLIWNGTSSSYKNVANQNTVKNIRIGNRATIDDYAFGKCHSLSSITIPDSVTSIGIYTFNQCYSLRSITIPDGVTSIGSNLFNACYSLTNITIPDGVTSIGSNSFSACNSLLNITIPDSVTSIGDSSFRNTTLSSITIPDSVTSIGSYAFYNSYSIRSITIPDGVTSIGNYAFGNCFSLKSAYFPDSLTSISDSMFNGCYSLTNITIPDSITSIGTYAFYNVNSLRSITIPDGVTSISESLFYSCYSLTNITIPDGVTSIGSGSFSGCNSLLNITIPDGVTSIGGNAFYNCYSLVVITIPDSVTSIGTYAFGGCYSLKEFHTLSVTPPTLGTNAFQYVPSDFIIFVPTGCLEAYKTASGWSLYASKMVEE